MELVTSFLLGIVVGTAVTYYVLKTSQQRKLIRDYESQLQHLREHHQHAIDGLLNEHQRAIKAAKDRSKDGSRAVIKGKIAEQLSPILPGFDYLPSEARFLGDPIDYVIFDGYTDVKDKNSSYEDLEIIILDVKTGTSSLSAGQKAIKKCCGAGTSSF